MIILGNFFCLFKENLPLRSEFFGAHLNSESVLFNVGFRDEWTTSEFVCCVFHRSDLPPPVQAFLDPDSPTQELESVLQDLMGLAQGVRTAILQ